MSDEIYTQWVMAVRFITVTYYNHRVEFDHRLQLVLDWIYHLLIIIWIVPLISLGLCLRYVQNSFSSDQESTIQATYLDKRLNVGKRSVKLMIWDTGKAVLMIAERFLVSTSTFDARCLEVRPVRLNSWCLWLWCLSV